MNRIEINALIKRRNAFLKRMEKTAKPSRQDQKEFCELRQLTQKAIKAQVQS